MEESADAFAVEEQVGRVAHGKIRSRWAAQQLCKNSLDSPKDRQQWRDVPACRVATQVHTDDKRSKLSATVTNRYASVRQHPGQFDSSFCV